MDKDKLEAAAKPTSLADYLINLPHEHDHGTNGRIETVRQDEHKGHQIVIKTTYEIEVDGKPRKVPLGVDNEGQLHCHALPNYQFLSAVDLVKFLIDIFPRDFPLDQDSEGQSGGGHGDHGTHPPVIEGGT